MSNMSYLDEILSLRQQLKEARALVDPDYDRAFLVAYRAHIIEECARVADDFKAKAVAAHIRALKD